MNAISGDISSAIKFLEENGYVVNGPSPPSARFLSDEEGEALPSSEMYLYIGGVVTCMLTAALAAGLTMGLLSIDPLKLAIKQKCGTDQEKRMAAAILPILSQHHLLLVTLLLMNAAANEALPLFLDELVPSYVAIVLSVTIVLFFGEELTALVQIQYESGTRNTTPDRSRSAINYDEVQIISGALTITTSTASDAMVSMSKVYSIPETTIMDSDMMVEICAVGHSRIPVYRPDPSDSSNRSLLTGFILTKKLVALDTTSPRPVSSLMLRSPLCVPPTRVLSDLLNDFQSASTHLAIVCLKPELAHNCLTRDQPIPKECKILGIITMEDIIEELLQEEILDETDRFEASALKRAKKVVRRWKSLVRRRRLARGEEVPEGMLSVRDVVSVARRQSRVGEGERDEEEGFKGEEGNEPLIDKKKTIKKKRSWYGGSG
ncbi:hypothetical protein TrRE_jg10934 [Triparma retinervis]|uniref:CNNM transmembrane domain-containing protein n=1 Tax=Triparma retinervis TaxID=2557542 RepID=A0A9W7DUU6_9STRA|nr:hypothetical protein TrRE_jg10934 [Triparma retinervis]